MNRNFIKEKSRLPVLGVGLGYRTAIAEQTLEHRDQIDFLEVISEHYTTAGPLKMKEIETAEKFQIIPHGVELSIGSTDEIDDQYLKNLKQFIELINAPWWSDHLSFTGADHAHLNNLIPLPFSKEAVDHVVRRARKVQEYIGVPFLLENITAYLRTPGGEMSEAQFISEILEQADCGMLLDVNNVYVNSLNYNFDPFDFIDQIPLDRVVQIHIAGHRKTREIVLDTHGAQISKPVYDLLAYVLKKTKVHAVLLERDQYFPKFDSLLRELQNIRDIAAPVQPELAEPASRMQILHAVA